MITLFLDTHSSDLNIGIVSENTFDEIKLKDVENHSNLFLCEVKKLLNRNNIEPNKIDNIVVVNGPGSFTGIRIAVACAKVYAYMLQKKIRTISSLKSYAMSVDDFDYVVSLIDARRNYYYASIYDKNMNEVLEECYIKSDDLFNKVNKLQGNIVYIGNANLENINVIKPDLNIKKIVDYCNNNIEPMQVHSVNPKYLKKTEAEEKNDKKDN